MLNNWLKGFAYRTDLNPLIFILAGGITIIIALSTIAAIIIQAANRNPVENLRYE